LHLDSQNTGQGIMKKSFIIEALNYIWWYCRKVSNVLVKPLVKFCNRFTLFEMFLLIGLPVLIVVGAVNGYDYGILFVMFLIGAPSALIHD